MSRRQEIEFMLTDIDYHFSEKEDKPIIKLYGKNQQGQVRITIKDFLPYFYVKKNSELLFVLQNDPFLKDWVVDTEELTLRQYFWGAKRTRVVKVYGRDPRKIFQMKQIAERLGLTTYETDIPFLKRYLLDTAVKCLNLVKVSCKEIEQKGNNFFAETSYQNITPLSEIDERSPSNVYPLKVMAINIKVAQDSESTQELLKEKRKRILAITVIWGSHGKAENGKLFLLQKDSNDAEKELIMDLMKCLQEIQPDILCSYRGDTFDFPYLFHRMRILKIPNQLLSLFGDESVFYSRRLLSYRIKGRMVFDLALRTWGVHPKSGKKGLYDVAEEVLNTTGYEQIEPLKLLWYSGVVEDCEDDLRLFAKQCFQDCKIIFELYWNLGMTGWVETLRVTGFPPFEGNSCTERINGEFELMRFMRRKGILIPSKPTEKEVEKNSKERMKNPHEGGTVLYPQGLLHTGVIILDFRSMYPSVMVAHNVGGETLKNWVPGSEHGNALKLFDNESRSALSIMEEELVEKRIGKKEKIKELRKKLEKIKNEKILKMLEQEIVILEREQNSMKIVANALYGAHYYVRSRFYSQALAGAIADSARKYLLSIKAYLQEISEKLIPCELIYGDTDSAFIKLLDNQLIKEIYEEEDPVKKEALTRLLKDNIVNTMLKKLNSQLPKPIELTLKDITYRCIFKPNRKKAYAYLSLLSGKIEIKGFEAVRSDWSPISQAAQRKVLEVFLREKEREEIEETIEEPLLKRRMHKKVEFNKAEKFLLEFGKRILATPTEHLLPHATTYSPIKRHPNQYKAMPPGVYAYLDYCKREGLDKDREWMTFDKFPWVVIPGSGPVFKRARHPKYVHDIDRPFYVRQMLLGIRTFGLETSLEDVMKTRNAALPNILPSLKEKEGDEKNFTGPIMPYSGEELTWQTPKKNTRKREQHIIAGQSQLGVFLEPKEEEDE